jgi:phosphoribosylformimino-5-aminoimidazole carboxamide ribotide isomerase
VAEACRAFPDRIIVGLDARDGRVATDGWAEVSALQATDLARRFANDGVSAIVYTDISRDGMLQGVNVEATLDIAQAGNIPVIASGGIQHARHPRLWPRSEGGIIGAITGRAIYEGTLDYAEAQRYCDRNG